MTNGLTLGFLVVVGAALAADGLINDWAGSLFLARRFMDLIAYVAFWR